MMTHGLRIVAFITLVICVLGQEKACPNAILPSYAQEWNTSTPEPVTVEWHSLDNVTCNDFSSCFGMSEIKETMEPQLPPLVLQPNTELRFTTNKRLAINITMKVYWVTESNFRSCEQSDGPSLNEEFTDSDIIVDSKYLRPGPNYFIGVTKSQFVSCMFGLRLNVTVKEERCREPGKTSMCNGQGRCVTSALQNNFHCLCCPGYSGLFCDSIDACFKKPCPSNATCIDDTEDKTGTKYECKCPLGSHGKNCEIHTDDLCTTTPCKNNATCTGNITSYECSCLQGFKGHQCEININDCMDNPCGQHGDCHDKVGGYYCQCVPGHGGKNCEHKFNECLTKPCQNEGVCVDKEDSYECHCPMGYTGQNCTEKVALCDPSPCQNAVDCEDHGPTYKCWCMAGFSGKNCEINMNECESSPCHQGSTCVDMVAGFKCLCPPSLTGERCQHRAHPNLPRPPDLMQYPHITMRRSHIHNLWIIAGTLLGALLIAVLVMAVCYCRFYGIRGPTSQFRYKQHQDDVRKRSESVKEGGPSLEAILEASQCDTEANGGLSVPLVRGLKSQKI